MTATKLNSTFLALCALALLFAFNVPVSAQQQESLTYDPQTGKYTMYYYSDDEPGKLERSVFELPNKIDPTVKSKVKISDAGPIRYEYKVTNGKESKQNLVLMRLLVSHAHAGLSTPDGWFGAVSPKGVTPEFIVGWFFRSSKPDNGLSPGHSQSGFGYESRDLAGVATIEAKGGVMPSPRGDYSGNMDPHGDTEIGKQYWNLLETSRYVRRFAAAPKIPNPTPFNAVVVLRGIQKHVKADMASMQLIDPPLLSLIDRGLTQAIAAAQGGNTPSLLHEIKSLRQLLKQEHTDVDQDNDGDDDDKEKKPKPRIDKLAAKVLDFDLKYVEKRI